MNRLQVLPAALVAGFFCLIAGDAPAQSPAKPAAPPLERTEHIWKDATRSSTFGAHWSGTELKMIREEMAERAGMIEKNEFFFNAGSLAALQTRSLSRAGEIR